MTFEPWETLTRTIVAFMVMLIAARIMGKKTVAELTSFDFVAVVAVGSIAAGIAFHLERNPYNVILSLLTYSGIAFLTGLITLKIRPARKLLSGEPTEIICNGKLLEENLEQVRYNLDNLNSALRQKGIFNIEQVEFAMVEPNGELSVQKKSQYRALTPNDLKIPTRDEGLAIELIMDGEIMHSNLQNYNLTQEWLDKTLSNHGIDSPNKVVYACLSTRGSLYFDLYNDNNS